jgi:outer membrane protein
MKYLVKIFVIIIFLFCNNLSYAENLIVYIDMEKILNESKSGMSINKQLEKIHKMNIKEFKKIEDELKKKEESIIAQKNILSKEDYTKKIKILRDNANSYRKNRQEKINLLTKKRMESSSKLLSIINPILSDYSKVNNISIILQKKNVVLAKTDLNITNKIIDILNSKIESINLN